MQTESIKAQAHRLLDNLPDSATWEDVMHWIYVRQAIDAGIKDSDEGRTVDVREVRKRFGFYYLELMLLLGHMLSPRFDFIISDQ
ncbi:MAG: hypothetical protein WAM73_15440 [Desulfobacterales bacterium]